MIQPGAPFVLFAPSHLATIALILGLAALLPALVLRTGMERWSRGLERFLALTLVVNEALKIWAWVALFGYPLKYMLPLHLCSIAVFLTAWLLLRRRGQRIFEVVYFWGLGGTLIALFTPDIPYAFPHPFYVYYFVSHGLIVIGVVYAALVFRLRPEPSSIVRIFGLTAAYAFLFILPLNFLLDTNYLYLRAKPEMNSPFDYLGPWPWYIGSLVLLTPVLFALCYSPYWLADRWQRTEPVQTDGAP